MLISIDRWRSKGLKFSFSLLLCLGVLACSVDPRNNSGIQKPQAKEEKSPGEEKFPGEEIPPPPAELTDRILYVQEGRWRIPQVHLLKSVNGQFASISVPPPDADERAVPEEIRQLVVSQSRIAYTNPSPSLASQPERRLNILRLVDATTGGPVAGFAPIVIDARAFMLVGNRLVFLRPPSAEDQASYLHIVDATTGRPLTGFEPVRGVTRFVLSGDRIAYLQQEDHEQGPRDPNDFPNDYEDRLTLHLLDANTGQAVAGFDPIPEVDRFALNNGFLIYNRRPFLLNRPNLGMMTVEPARVEFVDPASGHLLRRVEDERAQGNFLKIQGDFLFVRFGAADVNPRWSLFRLASGEYLFNAASNRIVFEGNLAGTLELNEGILNLFDTRNWGAAFNSPYGVSEFRMKGNRILYVQDDSSAEDRKTLHILETATQQPLRGYEPIHFQGFERGPIATMAGQMPDRRRTSLGRQVITYLEGGDPGEQRNRLRARRANPSWLNVLSAGTGLPMEGFQPIPGVLQAVVLEEGVKYDIPALTVAD